MTKRVHQDYFKRETAEVSQFVADLKDNSAPSGVFDSAAAEDFITESASRGDSKMPEKLATVLDEVGGEGKIKVTRAILDGISAFEGQHGTEPSADVIEQAIHSAYATTDDARRRFHLDSASSDHHDQISLQPNRAVIAILSAIGEAIPFAHYLPADIGSNEAILAIMTHDAGSTHGAYAEGAIMDGTHSGDSYISSSRVHKCTIAVDGEGEPTGAITGKLTTVQDSDETCAPASPGVKLLRGRSIVYVNGLVVGKEVDSSGTGNSTVSGTTVIEGTTYLIGGSINTDTGAIALTSTPALPVSVPVHVEGFIDYERDPSVTPRIISSVKTFRLNAKPWRVITQQTIDSRTQMANELGLDPYSESVIAIQAQFGNERHYETLLKAKRLAQNNQVDFDFDWDGQKQEKTLAQIWGDFASILAVVSQQMAIDTMNHGITHIYVGKNIAAQFMSLPRELFVPSGVVERPGIFRVGTLFGRYEVYYTPKVVVEGDTTAQILCIGRATDVTRNPFVLGDAVPPTVVPLAVNQDLKTGAGFYARNFTSVNPHGPSARGAAMINVKNLRH
ncbi:hypothetical protein [Pusillimonas noertemannii]|uniref:Uncharacterized protein n=1 Tax=Pusillimonas noertemannii TaxID=305977 RepID=A0A2U1CMG9_9BURK|nr:hypothetical protein [Pusillimonas noertemannii]NYT68794.1 hypothetical protein [Pusillimonas noertemannii]PVY62182.1 hypothetical protein C7440_1675 [Pusillimonas noertemannii]TFL10830.1 hypothetical protein CSC72_09980 [Pusillimonas noertemannii]